MSKVSATLGLTLRLSENNEYIRVSAEVSEVDTDLPLEPQLASVKKTYHAVLEECSTLIDDKLQELTEKRVLKT